MGKIKGHKTVVTTRITNDKNLSAGLQVGFRRENLSQFCRK